MCPVFCKVSFAACTDFMNGLYFVSQHVSFLPKNLHKSKIILNFVRFFGVNDCLFLGSVLKIEHFCERNENILYNIKSIKIQKL